jgi:hypothetical protein
MEPGARFNPYKRFTGIFVPESLLRLSRISPTAKLVYGRLARYAGADGRCFPAVGTLAAEIGLKERRARLCLAELETEKFIRRELQDGKTTRYVFLWHSAFDGESPRQDNTGVPRHYNAAHPGIIMPPPRQDSAAEESHHQESQEESHSRGASKDTNTNATPKRKRKPSPIKSDDESPAPRAPLPNPDDEFRARLAERHGSVVDADAVLADVRAELGDATLAEFVDADATATTAPQRLSNPHGHYRRLARRVGRGRGVTALQAALDTAASARKMITPTDTWRRATCCRDGRRVDGTYCACRTGETLRELDRRRQQAEIA